MLGGGWRKADYQVGISLPNCQFCIFVYQSILDSGNSPENQLDLFSLDHEKLFSVSRSRLEAQDKKKEILILVSKHEIERKKFSFSSRTWDWKKEILVPVSRIEIGFSSHPDLVFLGNIVIQVNIVILVILVNNVILMILVNNVILMILVNQWFWWFWYIF